MFNRVMHKMVTAILSKHIELSPSAFVERDGIAENLFILKSIADYRMKRYRSVLVLRVLHGHLWNT